MDKQSVQIQELYVNYLLFLFKSYLGNQKKVITYISKNINKTKPVHRI